jgi:uncharacterized cupin superfamily protein
VSNTDHGAGHAFWSNETGVLNSDLAKQLGAANMGARFWRLRPGQASTEHQHRETHELYVVIDGVGRIRVDGDLLELPRLSSVYVTPESVRQLLNDTEADVLWLVFGTPDS